LWHHYGRSSRGHGTEGLDGKDDEKAEGDEGQDAASDDEGLVMAGWYRGSVLRKGPRLVGHQHNEKRG
jgi:hypothetical protein